MRIVINMEGKNANHRPSGTWNRKVRNTMNTIKTLNSEATFEEIAKVSSLLNIEIEIDEDTRLYQAWADDEFKGSTGSKEGLIEIVNIEIAKHQVQIDDETDNAKKIESALKDSKKAVVINAQGNAVATVDTTAKRGGAIKVAGSMMDDGTAVNVRTMKVSFSKKHLDSSEQLPSLSANIDQFGDVFYI